MPAPDVQYVLDSSLQSGHIGGDTHFYLMEIAQDANEIVDGHQDAAANYDSHWQRLLHMGHYFEEHYVRWRAKNPADAKLASFQGLTNLPEILHEMVHSCAGKLVDDGHTSLTPSALLLLDETFEFGGTKQIMRRTLRRAQHDFEGWSPQGIADVRLVADGKREENRRAYDAAIARMMQGMHDQVNQSLVNMGAEPNGYEGFYIQTTCGTNSTVVPNYYPAGARRERTDKEIRDTQRMLAERVKQERRVIKRSVKFLTKLVGHDTTRMFISGDRVRFEGQHAIYELQKVTRLNNPHGGYRALSVFSKEHPDLMLCNICIYTPKVPLLDHVASLVMHIRAGEENEILKIGNASQVHESAYELPWLAPFLPKKYDRDAAPIFLNDEIAAFTNMSLSRRARYDLEKARLAKVLGRHIYDDVLAPYAALYRAANSFRAGVSASQIHWQVTVSNSVGTNAGVAGNGYVNLAHPMFGEPVRRQAFLAAQNEPDEDYVEAF